VDHDAELVNDSDVDVVAMSLGLRPIHHVDRLLQTRRPAGRFDGRRRHIGPEGKNRPFSFAATNFTPIWGKRLRRLGVSATNQWPGTPPILKIVMRCLKSRQNAANDAHGPGPGGTRDPP
jgi:hypothetical protein